MVYIVLLIVGLAEPDTYVMGYGIAQDMFYGVIALLVVDSAFAVWSNKDPSIISIGCNALVNDITVCYYIVREVINLMTESHKQRAMRRNPRSQRRTF